MSLTSGTRLGPYEVLAAIGSGGMGEVYKARDTRLGRTVAIKVLPEGTASDPERRRRFEQEARAASSLNHPHICVLFDIGDSVPTNPQSPKPNTLSSVSYLVMEHLEGETVAKRLAKGPLPLDQVLEVGAQIADALNAAHRHGIIHRDLKPANVILVKGDGATGPQAKLLDFGLARLTETSGRGAESATQSGSGVVVGTVPYMAPEQVEGRPADARTDVFALGAVLYEMLTGKRAFGGDSSAAVMAAILEHEPPALSSAQPRTPPALDRLVKRCLAKDPDARWQSAADVADELRWLRETSGTSAVAGVEFQRRRGLARALVVAGALAIAAAGAGVTWLLHPSPPAISMLRSALPVSPADEVNGGGWIPHLVPTPGGSRTALAWTPDGQALVFVGRRDGVQQLYVRRLDAAEARAIPGTERAQVPAVSADSESVAFWAKGAIRKVSTRGGPVVDLVVGVRLPPWGLVWDAHGGLFYGGSTEPIRQIAVGGRPTEVTHLREGELSHGQPWPLPGGRALIYTVRKRWFSWGDEDVVAQPLPTGDRKLLVTNAADARYVPATGHLVFLRRGVLYGVPFDPERLQLRGPEAPVLHPVAQALTAGNAYDVTGAGQFAVAPTGTLAWISAPVVEPQQSRLVTVDRRGQVTALPAPARAYGLWLLLSPDQRRLAVTIMTLTEVGLWVHDLARATPLLRLTTEGEVMWPVWGPDGQQVVFAWLTNGRWTLATQPADGTTAPRALVSGRVYPASVARDGRIACVQDEKDIVIVTIENGRARVEPLIQTAYTERWPAFSPDGRWLAYGSDVSGRSEVYVRPYPGPGGGRPGVSRRWLVSGVASERTRNLLHEPARPGRQAPDEGGHVHAGFAADARAAQGPL